MTLNRFWIAAPLLGLAVVVSQPDAHGRPGAELFYFVDAVNGVDLPSAGTKDQPFRTLTYAFTQLPPAPQPNLHLWVAPGLYDTAHGEAFPLAMRPGIFVAGSPDGQTILSAPAGVAAIQFTAPISGGVLPPLAPAGPELSHLTFQGEDSIGVTLQAHAGGALAPTLADLRFRDLGTALLLRPTQGLLQPVVERCEVLRCAQGLEVQGFFPFFGSVRLVDWIVRDSRRLGSISLLGGTFRVELDRVWLEGGAYAFTVASNLSRVELSVRASLLARLSEAVLRSEIWGSQVDHGVEVRWDDRTIVESIQLLELVGALGDAGHLHLALDHSVLWATGVSDPVLTAKGVAVSTSYCDLPPEWPLALGPSDTSVDPLFRASTNGDWRLAPDSPLVDAGDPNAPFGSLDLEQRPRSLDGDLDLNAVRDLGAFEFSQVELVLSGPAMLGSTLSLALDRPFGWLPVAFASTGTGSMDLGHLGALLLDLGSLQPVAVGPVALPSDPALVGLVIWLQGAAFDPVSPLGSTSGRVRIVLQ